MPTPSKRPKVLDEGTLRAAKLGEGASEYRVSSGTFVTPLAREYLRDRGIELVFTGERGEFTFVGDETGRGYEEKPESMTHLCGNRLVPKTHPRIAFRGKLDTLQGEIIMAQAEALEAGRTELVRSLGELLALARELLGAEVSGRPLAPFSLFGMDADAIRSASHNVEERFGIPHSVPNYEMGRLAIVLNLLRARVREAELAAFAAFGEDGREDILLAMNRMSSAVYILFCGLLADKGRG